MEIKWIRPVWNGNKGTLFFQNKQGEKQLDFGMGYNEFGLFPEEGYSDMIATKEAAGNRYRCACSADWAEPKKLRIKVQIIDKYFGNGSIILSFKETDDHKPAVTLLMTKTAEAFMREYEGIAYGFAQA